MLHVHLPLAKRVEDQNVAVEMVEKAEKAERVAKVG
jgi:hypothetical protein